MIDNTELTNETKDEGTVEILEISEVPAELKEARIAEIKEFLTLDMEEESRAKLLEELDLLQGDNVEVPGPEIEVTDEVVNEVVNEVVEEIVEEIEPEDPIKPAMVSGCAKLNVRKEANKESEVVCVVTPDSDLTVDVSKSTEEFYKVYTSVNEVLYEGYCIKKFIVIK